MKVVRKSDVITKSTPVPLISVGICDSPSKKFINRD